MFGAMSKKSKTFQEGLNSVGASQILLPSSGKLRQLLQAAAQGGLAQLRGDPRPGASPALCHSCADTPKAQLCWAGLAFVQAGQRWEGSV